MLLDCAVNCRDTLCPFPCITNLPDCWREQF